MKPKSVATIAALGFLVISFSALAGTITVTSTADNGPGSLRAALASATDGDTIDATGVTGTILLTTGELLVTNSVTILGPGHENLSIDGNHSSRVLDIASGAVSLSGFTITRGSADYGGGIYGSPVALTHCLISSNSASEAGGGLSCDSASIDHCTFLGNSAPAGGGMSASWSATITASAFVANSASSGGGIYNWYAMLAISNSTFSGNSASVGAGIENESFWFGLGPEVTLVNCTISGNTGDGIRNISFNESQYARLTVLNSTIASNTPSGIVNDDQGGFGDAITLIGSTILQASGPAVTTSGYINSMGYNLRNDAASGWSSQPSDLANTDPKLGPLQNNGGPTFTHALLPGSPAIEKGKNLGGSATDQRGVGFARTVDDLAVTHAPGGDGTDIGAFEVLNRAPVVQCQNVTVAAGLGCAAAASIDNGTYDPDGNAFSLVQSPPGPYPLGTNLVTLIATDSLGASSSCASLVVVQHSPVVLTVTNHADNGPGSLRQTIADACVGDTINFAVTGAIYLVTGELLVDKSLSIVGPGAAALAIDGNNSNRIFHITGSNTVTIANLTLTHGNAAFPPYNGGGIWNDRAVLQVSHCTIIGNYASGYGGGVYNEGEYAKPATLAVTDSALIYNRSAGYGGGIYSRYGTLFVTNSSFTSNEASGSGGGICNEDGQLTVVRSLLDFNSAGAFGFGGGICNRFASSVILNSALNQNSAGDGSGGGIYNYFSDLTVSSSSLFGNHAGSGGGIINRAATLTVANSFFLDNYASIGGGILNLRTQDDPALTVILNSSFGGNRGTNGAGGIYNTREAGSSTNAFIVIGGSLLHADPAGGLNVECGVGAVTSLGFNLSSDGGGGWLNQPTDLINTDPMLGSPYVDWSSGFAMRTLNLLPGSPAIDKGTNFTGTTLDQRGQPRTYDNPGVPNVQGGDGTDIGAVELIPPALSITLTATNTVMVSWPSLLPSPSTGFNPQVNTNLNSASWTAPAEAVQDNGIIRYLIVNPPTGNRFYRLKSP